MTRAKQVVRCDATCRFMSYLAEMMTFDQLFRYSEPGRVKRADTVRGPPLEINGASDAVFHSFNFKSYPSTTGLRHHGYIKFKRPELGRPNTPLQRVPCEVDCECPDFKYRFAWADKQRGAARIGAQSMNKCINRAPRITNPSNIPGLCKHVLACRDFIYGMKARFFPGEPDTGETLAKLVKHANTRWGEQPGDNTIWRGHMAKARDQEKWFAAVKDAVNAGRAGDVDYIYQLYQQRGGTGLGLPRGIPPRNGPAPPPGPEPPPEEPPTLPRAPRRPRRGPELPAAGRPSVRARPAPAPAPPVKAPALPAKRPALAVPPGKRGRTLPENPPGGTMGRITPPGKRGRGMPPYSEALQRFLAALVDRVNGSSDGANQITESMSQLKKAIQLIEEIQDDEVKSPHEIASEMAPPAADDIGAEAPPPSEPPVEDTAVGADTEANVVLQLLADIRRFLAMLVGEEEAEGELPGEEGVEGEGPPIPPEGEDEEEGPVDAIPEPPEDEEDEDEDEEDEYNKAGKGPSNPEAD